MTKPSYEELVKEQALFYDQMQEALGLPNDGRTWFGTGLLARAKTLVEREAELARVRGLLQRIAHRLNRQLMGGVGSTHEDANLFREIEQILTGAESADIGKLDTADEKVGYCGGCRSLTRNDHSCVHGNCLCECNPGSAETGGEKA